MPPIRYRLIGRANWLSKLARWEGLWRVWALHSPSRPQATVGDPAMALDMGGLDHQERGAGICQHAQMGHVWTVPAVQEEFDYQRSVRVRSCIRPVVAWRITSVAMQPLWPLALM